MQNRRAVTEGSWKAWVTVTRNLPACPIAKWGRDNCFHCLTPPLPNAHYLAKAYTRMGKITRIDRWLTVTRSSSAKGKYRHLLLKENTAQWPSVRAEVQSYFRTAHKDALQHYQMLAGISLDPRQPRSSRDPALLYPHQLHSTVLAGYFGEVFAGIIAEHFAPHGEDGWEVPAFLFRKHNIAFEQLESCFQKKDKYLKPIPGRTGDDCLAFRRNTDGSIKRSLYCEAKCTKDHNASMISEAHKKVNSSAMVSILQIIETLLRRGTDEAKRWVDALRQYRLKITLTSSDRLNFVSYVCGRTPKNAATWIPQDKPHSTYSSAAKLEATEVHLANVEATINAVYGKDAWK